MPTQTEEKIYKELKEIRKETKTLKELVFLVLKDQEGEYKDSFIKRVFKKTSSRPEFIFTGKKDFLKMVS